MIEYLYPYSALPSILVHFKLFSMMRGASGPRRDFSCQRRNFGFSVSLPSRSVVLVGMIFDNVIVPASSATLFSREQVIVFKA